MIVAVLDYRAGNLASVVKGLSAAGASPRLVTRAADIASADAIVIPGVGHFDATRAIGDEARSAISARMEAGVAVLGICLGMQWLFDGSDEAPDLKGLGVFRGCCTRLAGSGRVKIPHVGWNTLDRTVRPSRLLEGLPHGTTAYFTHSYAAPVGKETVASTTHGATFASVVENGRVFGTQFHPEKSGAAGLHMLRQFVEAAREAGARC